MSEVILYRVHGKANIRGDHGRITLHDLNGLVSKTKAKIDKFYWPSTSPVALVVNEVSGPQDLLQKFTARFRGIAVFLRC